MNSLLDNYPGQNFNDFPQKLQDLINEKNICIDELISYKQDNSDEFNELKSSGIKDLIEQVNNYEEENLRIINERKVFLSGEISRLNRTEKALSAYKFKKQERPRMVDEKDSDE